MRSLKALLAGVCILGAVAAVDCALGSEIGSDTFYLAPVVCVAWMSGFLPALAIALASAVAWIYVDTALLHHVYADPTAPYINAAIALALFSAAAYLVARLRAALTRERELSHLQSQLLSLAGREMLDGPGAQLSLKKTIENLVAHGGVTLEPSEVDLRRLVEELVAQAKPLALKGPVDLSCSFDESVVPVRADPAALSLVVSTLLYNAIRRTPPMGRVVLETRKIASKVELSIGNDDLGISPEQALVGVTDASLAAGLKLSRELLKSHGSDLQIEAIPGKGSRVAFLVDAATAAAPSENPGS